MSIQKFMLDLFRLNVKGFKRSISRSREQHLIILSELQSQNLIIVNVNSMVIDLISTKIIDFN